MTADDRQDDPTPVSRPPRRTLPRVMARFDALDDEVIDQLLRGTTPAGCGDLSPVADFAALVRQRVAAADPPSIGPSLHAQIQQQPRVPARFAGAAHRQLRLAAISFAAVAMVVGVAAQQNALQTECSGSSRTRRVTWASLCLAPSRRPSPSPRSSRRPSRGRHRPRTWVKRPVARPQTTATLRLPTRRPRSPLVLLGLASRPRRAARPRRPRVAQPQPTRERPATTSQPPQPRLPPTATAGTARATGHRRRSEPIRPVAPALRSVVIGRSITWCPYPLRRTPRSYPWTTER